MCIYGSYLWEYGSYMWEYDSVPLSGDERRCGPYPLSLLWICVSRIYSRGIVEYILEFRECPFGFHKWV